MADHWTRVATGNLPEQGKPGLLREPARARAALALMEREHITMFGAQEAGTHLAAACREHPHFAIVRATPNENRNGRERGNVLVYDRREWRMERDRDLTLRIPDGPARRPSKTQTRPIHQARVRFTHLPSDRQVRVWAVHKPRDVRGYQNARGRLDGRLEGAAEKWHDDDLLAILLGDFNGAPPNLDGMRRRASHGPDSIVATAGLEWRGVQAHPLGRISDHRMAVSVELAIPDRAGVAWKPAA